MDYMLEKLREQGFSAAHLWALDKNLHTRRVYEKYGFAASGKEMTQAVFGEPARELEYRISL